MRDEELEKLDFDSFDEDEFMLNKSNNTLSEIIDEDSVVDTFIEKDFSDSLEVMEEVTPDNKEEVKEIDELKEEKDVIESREERRKNKNKKEKKVKKEKVKKEKKEKVKKTKKEKKKSSGFKFPKTTGARILYIIEAIFCLVSISFVIYCCYHYGTRLFKYYRIYNPKTEDGERIELIGITLNSKFAYVTEGSGTYKVAGASIFKGEDVNNYFRFGDYLWRIVSVNVDGSVELVLDGYINSLSFNDKVINYKDSDINKYLNNVFLDTLDKKYMVETSYCLDEVEDIANVSCTSTVTDTYVRLLGVTEFINSKIDGLTYLSSDNKYWIYNSAKTGAWAVNGTNLSLVNVTSSSLVKPVIRIKNSVQLLGGDGTKENPYYVEKEKNELKLGSYVKLGEDIWVVYELKDKTMNLALDKSLTHTYRFSTTTNAYDVNDTRSLAQYLNNGYLESLPYKDLINENDWYNGSYNHKYENIYKSTVKAKVGLYNVADMKFGNIEEMYYLMTPAKTGYAYYYDVGLFESKVALVRNIKPAININKAKIINGKGTLEEPYELEV